MSETIAVEKSGMLINAEKEIVGWVNAGDQIELKEGDLVVSHPSTAKKHGVLEQYNTMKADNAPKKEPKPKAEGGATRTRTECPKTGIYEVAKAKAAELKEGEVAGPRHEILTKLLSGTSFEKFWEGTPETFEHPGREGDTKTFTTSGLVIYAIKRGMIVVKDTAAA